ncbi:MAG: trimethylamine methyltransferase family protein [Phyllobacteriaceae bacterium]|nr:trimethylamine methyltransferase family protein [Phyllobacteriaceae bacterium]
MVDNANGGETAASSGPSRRSGGREARRAARSAPLSDELKPVRPGLEGGRYRPLSDADVGRIHEAALDLLERLGFGAAPASTIAACAKVGALHGDDGRLRFPRAVVENAIANAGRDITLYGQDPRHDMQISGARVHYGTAGAAVHVVDVEKREYRESQLQDLYDAARIVDVMDNIHFFQRTMVPRDIPDPFDMDLNTLYAAVSGTTKHVGTSFTHRDHVGPALDMLYAIAGGEDAFRARPFVSNSNCFVVPPMKYAEDACGVLEACVEGGIPILLLSAGQAGATAPASIAGAVVQAVAEVLAGFVYVNALKPGHPAIFGTWPFVSDLRTGAMSGGSGEQALLTAACAQMALFYNLPGGSAAGMADAKLPDVQSGYEKGITDVMAGLSGLNLVYEAAGMHASLLGFSLESLIIDNDMLGQCLRCVRGIDMSEEALSVDTIIDVCVNGPGHYLGHEQTLARMQRDYFYPALGDRSSPKEWVEKGRPDIVARAVAEKRRILTTHFPVHVTEALDRELRSRFPAIRLPRAAMTA